MAANVRTTLYDATKTSAGAGATEIDISAKAEPWTIHFRITEQKSATGTPGSRWVIEDTENDFTAAEPVISFYVKGPVSGEGKTFTFTSKDFKARFGVTSAELRARLVAIEGGTPSVTAFAVLEEN